MTRLTVEASVWKTRESQLFELPTPVLGEVAQILWLDSVMLEFAG